MAKRIIFPEKGRVELVNFEPDTPAVDEVQVRTLYSLMSIGTETTILHQRYDPDTHFARMFSFPQLKTGMQAVGEVVSTGKHVTDFANGDYVFMRMAHGSHQTLRGELLSPVPDNIDLKQACWCGLAKTAFRAAWAADAIAGGRILVIGGGPVGQMLLRWLSARGVKDAIAADLSEFRLELARHGGAAYCLSGDIAEQLGALSDITDGNGLSVVIDTTGNPVALTHAMAAAARFGKIILLGDTGFPDRQRLSSDMMTKGLTIQATHDSHDRDGWTQSRIDTEFFELVGAGRFNLDKLITHQFSPDRCEEAYELAENDRGRVMGILFDWSAQVQTESM